MISNTPPVNAHTTYPGYGNEAFDVTNRIVGQLNTEADINMELWVKLLLDKTNQFNIGTPPVDEPSVVPAIYFDDPEITFIDENNNRTTYNLEGGAGDMLKSIYDSNNDGIVDQADVITNQGDLATLDTVGTDQIDNSAVTNAKLAHMNANTIKGRLSGNGTPQDIDMVDLPVSTATQTALDGKVDENAAITGATKTKITYDAKGLVTSGVDATTADIADSSNKRYVTDAQLTVIGNTSGTNTGDNATNSQYSGLASSKQDTLVSGTNIKTINGNSLLGSGDLTIGGSTTKTIQFTIPGVQAVDASNAQQQRRNNTGATITISNIAVAVGKPAAGTGAAFTVNVYKSSGTASDGINTSATALFSTAIALGTSAEALTNTPTTTTVEAGRTITIRVTASAGATNFASDASFTITYT